MSQGQQQEQTQQQQQQPLGFGTNGTSQAQIPITTGPQPLIANQPKPVIATTQSSVIPGYWAADPKTGYRWVTPAIVSGPDVVKEPFTLGGEKWGSYKKLYTRSMFGQNLFTPPEQVDGVPILCACSRIRFYVRDSHGRRKTNPMGALLFGSSRPACWTDNRSIMNPSGGDSFSVIVGHPEFYTYAVNTGDLGRLVTGFRAMGGRRKTRRRGKRKQLTRKNRR